MIKALQDNLASMDFRVKKGKEVPQAPQVFLAVKGVMGRKDLKGTTEDLGRMASVVKMDPKVYLDLPDTYHQMSSSNGKVLKASSKSNAKIHHKVIFELFYGIAEVNVVIKEVLDLEDSPDLKAPIR